MTDSLGPASLGASRLSTRSTAVRERGRLLQDFVKYLLGKRLSRVLLDFDSRVDSSLYGAGVMARAAYTSFSSRMDQLHVSGFARFGVEAACEGLTLGLGGAILALALAIPAFRETSDNDWLKKQDLAVTFLDRTGEQVGQRGIRHGCVCSRESSGMTPVASAPHVSLPTIPGSLDKKGQNHFYEPIS